MNKDTREITSERAIYILDEYFLQVGLFMTRPLLTEEEEDIDYTKHVYAIAWDEALRSLKEG